MKLTQGYKPWMDIFKSMNSNEFAKNLIDFGDDFLLSMAFQRQYFLTRYF